MRAWSSADGNLLWERTAGSAAAGLNGGELFALAEADADASNRVALVMEDSIQVLDGAPS